MILLGKLALTLALVLSVASIVFLALGVRTDRKDLIKNGYYAVYGFFLATVVASAVLLQAFLAKDFSFAYVTENSDATLSAFYRVAGFWAGQQGSFLLWLLLIAIVVVIVAFRDIERLERITAGAVMMLAVTGAVFAGLMVFSKESNPFEKAAAGTQPYGLNPLLLHPAMVLHPPALFVGYVGLSVPMAFAVSALLLGRSDRRWVQLSQKWAIFGWLFLSLGIGLGAWWAYVVLSFGGYWAWDPVESTSLVPWLAATALLHSFTMYRTRGLYKRWALGLAVAAFWFTILATWTTRTGLIQSVHAFSENPLMVWVLSSFLVVVAVGGAGLLIWRWRTFETHDEIDSWASRDFLYYVTNLLLSLFAGAVAFVTVVPPLLMGRTVGPETFNSIAQPLGVVTLALIGICPLLGWRKTEGAPLRRTLILPGVTAALSVPLWLALGFQSDWKGFVGLLVCGFTFGAVIQFVLRAARRAAGPGKSLWAGMGRAFTGSRSRTASYIVHFGMVLVVAGLIGSNIYKTDVHTLVNITSKGNGTQQVDGYRVVYKGMTTTTGAQSSTDSIATFDVFKGSTLVGTVKPQTDVYPVAGAAVRASILGGWKRDVFVVADQPFDKTSKTIALRTILFPLIRFVWVGAILLVAGAAVSLWPKGRTQEQEARAAAVEDSGIGPDQITA